jgi:hypothetical protein
MLIKFLLKFMIFCNLLKFWELIILKHYITFVKFSLKAVTHVCILNMYYHKIIYVKIYIIFVFFLFFGADKLKTFL